MGKGGKGKGGGKGKSGGKKRKAAKKQWDDAYGEERATLGVSVNDIADAAPGGAMPSSSKKQRTGDRPAARESMMAQWKKRKQVQRNKHKTFASKAEEKKYMQRQQYEQQRRRAANAVYGSTEVAAQRDAPDAQEEMRESERDSEDDEEDEDEDEEEDDAVTRRGKRRSVFDQFVQTFQPASLAMEEEDEEEDDDDDDEVEYEEIEVDEDGNPIEDPVADEDADDDDDRSEQDDDAEESAEAEGVEEDEEEDDDMGADDSNSVDDDADASTADVDPYRHRFLLGQFSETDAKRFDAAARKFVSISRQTEEIPTPILEEFNVSYKPGVHNNSITKDAPLSWMPNELNVRSRLKDAWSSKQIVDLATWRDDAPLEHTLFTQMSSYADILFAGQTYELTQPLRRLTAMHVVNHVLKSRDTVTRNNERLRKRQNKSNDSEESTTSAEEDDEMEYRDQGFSRPTVLVMMPLRSSAYSFVQELLELLPSTVSMFHNKDRFDDEYRGADETSSDEDDEIDEDEDGDGDEHNGDSIEKTSKTKNRKQRRRRPIEKEELKEWQRVFSEGNNDDSFQIGISFTRRSIKFYSDYRQADIILASPLGLRQQIGDELVDVAEKQVITADFLSSIEVCVLDSASLLLMQNIEHVRLLLQAINVKPKEAPNADFSRLREWNLSFLGAYFRQTIVFAHGVEPALLNLVNKCCKNQSGVIKYVRNYDSNIDASAASITQVVPKVKQIFQRIDLGHSVLSARDEVELRFEYFQKHIFAPLLDQPRRHVLIFVPSYFDYVRIRNLFHDTMNQKIIRAVQCCEYTESRQVTRARTTFFHGRCHVMLFTERFHFYHQYRIRGIHQLIWYGLPQMGEFYPEMLNMFEDNADDDVQEQSRSSIALFTRLDLLRLQRVVGQKRAERMCQSTAKKSTFLFC